MNGFHPAMAQHLFHALAGPGAPSRRIDRHRAIRRRFPDRLRHPLHQHTETLVVHAAAGFNVELVQRRGRRPAQHFQQHPVVFVHWAGPVPAHAYRARAGAAGRHQQQAAQRIGQMGRVAVRAVDHQRAPMLRGLGADSVQHGARQIAACGRQQAAGAVVALRDREAVRLPEPPGGIACNIQRMTFVVGRGQAGLDGGEPLQALGQWLPAYVADRGCKRLAQYFRFFYSVHTWLLPSMLVRRRGCDGRIGCFPRTGRRQRHRLVPSLWGNAGASQCPCAKKADSYSLFGIIMTVIM